MHGPPGTGKTLLARACAKQTDAIFLKLAGPQLVRCSMGMNKIGRDAFELAKEKSNLASSQRITTMICLLRQQSGAIVFIDELGTIGTKRFGGEQ